MKIKRIWLLLVLISVMATITIASAANIQDENDIQDKDNKIIEHEYENGKYTLTNEKGDTIEVYKGIVYEDEPTDNMEERIKYILRDEETGHFTNILTGDIDTNEVKDKIQIIMPDRTSKPTKIKTGNYTHDWSGTVNFTYTEYGFPSGNFVAWADQPFSVVLYDFEYDTSFGRVYAEYLNGRYEVETGGGNFSYYCTLSNTNKGVPMTNAIYKSIPHWWHSN